MNPAPNEADNWHKHAACLGYGEVMFPTVKVGGNFDPEDLVAPFARCDVCPVTDECLTDALEMGDTNDVIGIRAKTTHIERRRMRAAERTRKHRERKKEQA